MNSLRPEVQPGMVKETQPQACDLPNVKGQDLEVARRDDRSWRASRRERTLGVLQVLESRYTGATDFLTRLGAVAAIVLLIGVLTMVVVGLVGGFHLIKVGAALMLLGLAGVFSLIALGGVCWLIRLGIDRVVRLWARRQVIDLVQEAEGTE